VEDDLLQACTRLQQLEKQTARELSPAVADEEAVATEEQETDREARVSRARRPN
jgi:hypothetical protein